MWHSSIGLVMDKILMDEVFGISTSSINCHYVKYQMIKWFRVLDTCLVLIMKEL